jgi:hypothetical protein
MSESGATIEQEIAQLEKQLQEKKANLGKQSEQTESLPDKEILRQVVGEKIQQHSSAQSDTPVYVPKPTPAPATDDNLGHFTEELKNKIQELVNHVFQNSLEDGIKEAVKLKNPALIDAFHDVLVDQLYDTLLERKKIEKVN